MLICVSLQLPPRANVDNAQQLPVLSWPRPRVAMQPAAPQGPGSAMSQFMQVVGAAQSTLACQVRHNNPSTALLAVVFEQLLHCSLV